METKYFTHEQANAMIPYVDEHLRKIQALKKQFTDKMIALRQLKESRNASTQAENDPYFMQEAEIEFIQLEAKSHIQAFRQKGIELKDIDQGLVDFPSIMHGEVVLLCWKQGESEIAFYHSRQEGYAGRKPIHDVF